MHKRRLNFQKLFQLQPIKSFVVLSGSVAASRQYFADRPEKIKKRKIRYRPFLLIYFHGDNSRISFFYVLYKFCDHNNVSKRKTTTKNTRNVPSFSRTSPPRLFFADKFIRYGQQLTPRFRTQYTR